MKLIKLLICLLFLTSLTSCAIEGPDCSNATFSLTAWQNEAGMIRISYQGELRGYELSVGCPDPDGYAPEQYKLLDRNETKNWAEWSIIRECTPEYIRVRSLDGRIEKTIYL